MHPSTMRSPLFIQTIFSVAFILTVNADCSTTRTVNCTTNTGNPGDKTVGCLNPAHTLVSCGIRNDAASKAIISRGTRMSDDQCTIDYHLSSNTASATDVTPYARCCNFVECFGDFQCTLSVSREKKLSPDSASCPTDAFPHLLSCGLGINNNAQQVELYFQNSGTNSNLTFRMADDYLNLFGLPTTSPTKNPTRAPTTAPSKLTTAPSVHPTIGPTVSPVPTAVTTSTSNPTVSPTIHPTASTSNPSSSPVTTTSNPTVSPTITPTVSPVPTATQAPTPSPSAYVRNNQSYAQSVNTVWFPSRTARPECVPQSQTVSNYTWLSSLCCVERNNTKFTSSPSVPPTLSPTQVPTNSTPSPLWRLSDVRNFYTFTTPFFPINGSVNESTQFEDFNYGQITSLNWGVSNIQREYTIATVGKPGIIGVNDTELTDWYFTIKEWDAETGFTSQYGNIHIPTDGTCMYCNCTPVNALIQQIEIYSEITNQVSKILGMTMVTDSSVKYTCHVDMGRNNISGSQMETTLSNLNLNESTNPAKYTLDYSTCKGYLAGFKGSAHRFGIEYIGFIFSSTWSSVGSCEYADATGPVSPPSPAPSPLPTGSPSRVGATLSPSPGPTKFPTESPTASPTAPVVDQFKTNERTLGCYYVMDKQKANCLSSTGRIKQPQNIPLTNPSFMTGCVGYSQTDDIKSWYIDETETCVVEGYDNSAVEMAAIATCCTLVDKAATASSCSNTDLWCVLGITNQWEKVGIVSGITFVAAFWIGAIIWCVYATKRQRDRDALEERLAKFETAENAQGETVRVLTEEQVTHQLNLERFEVDPADHREMLEKARLMSGDVGLIE